MTFQCDETLPSCKRCNQRREKCSYLEEYASTASPSSESAVPASGASISPQPQLSISDLDLTHQFLTQTYITLWGNEEGRLIWRDTVFRLSFSHRFLLDAILATTALHRIILVGAPCPEYEDIVLRKQTPALEGLQMLLRNLDGANANITFAMSTLVSYWAFASRSLPDRLSILGTPSDSDGKTSVISQFIELLRKVQPTSTVLGHFRECVYQGNLRGLTRIPDDGTLPDLPQDERDVIANLERALQRTRCIPAVRPECHPMWVMAYMFRIRQCPEWYHLLVGWVMQLSDGYIELVRRRDHAALTVLSFWAVCLDELDDRWWAAGWSKALVCEISSLVEGEWATLLKWPRRWLKLGVDEW